MKRPTKRHIAGAAILVAALTQAGLTLAQQAGDGKKNDAVAAQTQVVSTAGERTDRAPPIAATPSRAISKVMIEFRDAQNRQRTARGLPPLIWSDALADDARKAIDEISESRSCGAGAARLATKDINANFYWAPPIRRIGGAAAEQDLSPRYVVSEWNLGEADYVADNKSCKPETRDCLAYAQMMQPDVRLVGCAQTTCSNNAQVWVCRYEGEQRPAETPAAN